MVAARPGPVRLTLGPLREQAIGSWLRPGARTARRPARRSGCSRRRRAASRYGSATSVAATAAAGPLGRPSVGWLAAAAITADDLVIDTALVAGHA